MRMIWVLLLCACGLAAGPLPGTAELTDPGDIASEMVSGIDSFLLKQTEAAAKERGKYWHRDYSSAEGYEKSIEQNRHDLARILGVVDARVPYDAPELLATAERSAVVAKGDGYEVLAIRWPVFGEIWGEGLMLRPTGRIKADVVAIPDCAQTPEELAGMVQGLAKERQWARRLAEAGCRVMVPVLVDRECVIRPTISNREFIYRPAYELGRHVIGYEVQKILAAVDYLSKGERKVAVVGYGEGGMLALYAGALDRRIGLTMVSGYFGPREGVWEEPIDRNVFGLLREFGDAEIAAMIAPRGLVVEPGKAAEMVSVKGAAPGRIVTPPLEEVNKELERGKKLAGKFSGEMKTAEDGLGAVMEALGAKDAAGGKVEVLSQVDAKQREARQIRQMDAENQALLGDSADVRKKFMAGLDTSSLEKYEASAAAYRKKFEEEVIGKFDVPLLPPNPRTRFFMENDKFTAYEVLLDVFPEVEAYGLLLIPKGIKPGEKRPVVVCQHGLEAHAKDVVMGDSKSYHNFAARLAEEGFITFAPQNPYIFHDRFRTLQRKANPLGKTLFSIIVPQHRQILNFLKSRPEVDGSRIAFYGLSYGGKTAMRVPAIVTDYCLSICSGDFNEWIWKNASTKSPYSYVWTGEYEMFEFNLGQTFNYAEMAALIAPRPFMVERGHADTVSCDEEVAYEFAKVRRLYEAGLKLPSERCQIEFFDGPHTINGKGTFAFLRHWLKEGALPLKTQAALPVPDAARNARGLDSALEHLHAPTRGTKPLPPQEALKHLKPADGLKVELLAAEPVVRQPLNIQFDARGRMWVTQYIQYPVPAGLKVVEYDQYIRAKFDKTPLPPPHGTPGADKITIHDHGTVKPFVEHLNIATSCLPDIDGVWVLNPPYLLFYPDKNHDDVPDGDPVVHLSGFGLEDTHAVANSLRWGPDGWIYGAQGSTCTAQVKVEIEHQQSTTDFLGQAIWRYHPTKHLFEIFAEGGGNTFGVEFDDKGRLYSGTNWGKYRGFHYVQGGYYLKSWGKHGPLTNPYAFGYFDHMPHKGDATRLVHTFSIYGGGLLPRRYWGKILGPSPLQSRVQVTRIEPMGSTFHTTEEAPLLTSDDGWFRPVDLKAGPDGALYVADFYENRISHVDPRDTWDRSNGRIYRIAPPGATARMPDLTRYTPAQLVQLLESDNRWIRWTARRLIAAHHETSIIPTLKLLLPGRDHPQLSLEALWTLHGLGAIDNDLAAQMLVQADPDVRLWMVRLLGDEKKALPEPLYSMMGDLARQETNPSVRSQIACTLKRLPAEQSLPILSQMLYRPEDLKDPHIPLLLWWAVEDKATSARDAVVKMFSGTQGWSSALARQIILPRLARRYASQPTQPNQQALVTLLENAPGDAERAILFDGIAQAFAGGTMSPADFTPALAQWLARSGNIEIALRSGDAAAHAKALDMIANPKPQDRAQRVRLIEILGQVGKPNAIGVLLNIVQSDADAAARRAALGALGHFEEDSIGQSVVKEYPKLPRDLKRSAISLLVSRPAWAGQLCSAIDAKVIPREDVALEQIDQLRRLDDRALTASLNRIFGPPTHSSSAEKEREIARIKSIVLAAPGDAKKGRDVFTARCAVCHTLFGQGAKIGPDLTPYERRNVDFLLLSVVDPSAYVREEFQSFLVVTKDNQMLVGLITERSANQITLTDSTQRRITLSKPRIKTERALAESIMPEGLTMGMTDAQLRDLFAYVMSDQPPGK